MPNAAAAAPPAAEAAPAPLRKGKKKIILIGAVVALVLAAVAATAAVLLLKKPAEPVDEDAEEVAQVEKSRAKESPAPTRHDAKNPPPFAPLEPFTVNLADRDVERYAQIALTLELDHPKTVDAVKAFMPAIRNNILMVLAHKTSAQILGAEGKARLAAEIQRASSRALGVVVDEPGEEAEAADPARKGKKKRRPPVQLPVVAVHFSNFIVQ